MTGEQQLLLMASWRATSAVREELITDWQRRLVALDAQLGRLAATAHPAALAAGLEGVVLAVGNPERLVERAAHWGRSPSAQGLSARHYQLAGEALRASLQQLLATHWSRELNEAWAEALGLVASVIQRSAARASGELPRPTVHTGED